MKNTEGCFQKEPRSYKNYKTGELNANVLDELGARSGATSYCQRNIS